MTQTKTTTATKQTEELKNLSLTLYAYQIRSSNIDPDENKTDKDADALWENLIRLGDNLKIPQFQSLRQQLICYENGKYSPENEAKSLPANLSLLKEKLVGISVGNIKTALEIYRLKDIYAADLTFYSQATFTIDQLTKLNPNGSLLPQNIQASLGQSLLFFAEPVGEVTNYQELADACVTELLKGGDKWQFAQEGKLLGKPIFEYEISDKQTGFKSQILVWFRDIEAGKKAANINWTSLLCCRHKIVRFSQKSRQTYYKGRKFYAELETQIKEFPDKIGNKDERLDYLTEKLKELPGNYLRYVSCLRDLKDQLNTVVTNSKNYKTCVKMGGSPEFLERFFKKIELWQTQIETDLNYLSPGQELFEQMVSTARGIAELDQAESDRSLERTIQVLGAGLGSGAIVASAIAGHIETPITLKPTNQFHPAITTLFWSIIIGLFFGGVVWLGTGGWSWFKDKVKNKN